MSLSTIHVVDGALKGSTITNAYGRKNNVKNDRIYSNYFLNYNCKMQHIQLAISYYAK